ncbi:MAG: hypothetical protein V7708_00985 [Oceanicoccus sp.]
MEWIDGHDSWFVWLMAALVVHVFLAIFESNEIRWVPKLSTRSALFWHLVVWLLPFIGVGIARKELHLPKTKGTGHPDTNNANQDLFDN